MESLYLGFDTSCYTTSVACISSESIVLDERTVLSVPFGARGLRQSDALFQHNRNLPALLSRLFSSVDPARIAGVGVSVTPTAQEGSYMPVFLAGQVAAKTAAGACSVPLVGTTHQHGHVRAALHGGNEHILKKDRFLALHISGGTTDVLEVHTESERIASIQQLGCSNDLHAGQMVDRLGVAMELPFPCGKHLEQLAETAVRKDVKFASSVRGLSCSLSGAETQAQRVLQSGEDRAEVAYGIYDCLARTLSKLIQNTAAETGCRDVLLSGGVASSLLLRELLHSRLKRDIRISFGRSELSGDNAVGVALLARDQLCSGKI